MTQCMKCDLEIEGEIVWWHPFESARVPADEPQTLDLMSGAGTAVQENDNQSPYHPACYTELTGQAWPPPQQP